MTATDPLDRLRRALASPADPASLAAFRVGFGLLIALAALRFVLMGWVDALLLAPRFHFAWLPAALVPPAPALYGLFAVQMAAGLGVALGWRPRACLAAWLASFVYVELLDKALYLNHYVLLTLLGAWLLIAPIHRVGLRDGSTIPVWALWLLRAQLATVYIWAGIAKINADWLLRAEPLTSWLQARADVPVIGPALALDATAVAMSWGGAAYDLLIPFLLLLPRTRAAGVALVVFFHAAVGALFPIGVFPWVMALGATLFLDPSWPRRWLGGAAPEQAPCARRLSMGATLAWVSAVACMALIPARALGEGAEANWTERGYRFAWRVLLNEKTGFVDFRVVERGTGKTWMVSPAEELTTLQHQQMRTQPDMIRDYALHLRDVHARRGRRVAVYADAWASLNGRPSQRLLRPDLDLTRPLDDLEAEGWIVPLEALALPR